MFGDFFRGLETGASPLCEGYGGEEEAAGEAEAGKPIACGEIGAAAAIQTRFHDEYAFGTARALLQDSPIAVDRG